MNNFIKENWFKLTMLLLLLIIVFSIFYYFIIYLPGYRHEKSSKLSACFNLAEINYDKRLDMCGSWDCRVQVDKQLQDEKENCLRRFPQD